jgi:drug/metabolite transporter (DMT)-like permease
MMAVRQSDGDRAEGRRVVQGAGLAIAAAVAFGGFFVMIHASHGDLFWVLLVQRIATVVLLLVVALATAVKPMPVLGDFAPLAAIGLLDAAATALFTASARVGMLSVVAVVASLYPVVTLLLARVVLRERLSRFQGTGVGLALVGIALIAV